MGVLARIRALRRRQPQLLAVAAAVPLVVSLIHAIGHLDRDREAKARAAWEFRLAARADAQRLAVESAVREVEGDAAVIAGYPTLAWLTQHRTGPPYPFPVEQGAAAHLRDLLDGLTRTQGYTSAWVVGSDGQPLASSTDAGAMPGEARALARTVQSEGRARVQLVSTAGEAHLLGAAPVINPGETHGAALLAIPLRTMLRDALDSTLMPTISGKTVLAIRERGDVIFVTKDASGSAGQRLSAGTPGIAMARALEGHSDFGAFVDRSGRPVLAATRPLSPGWGLVVQVDEDEALADVRASRRENALILAGTLFVAGVLALLGIRQRGAARQARMAEYQQRLLTMVERIAEAIFMVDGSLRIREALGNVEGLYGRPPQWFVGRTVAEVRHPDQRATIGALFERLRKDGRATVETTHLRHDGSSLRVEVSLRVLSPGADPEFVAVVRSLEPRETAEVRLRAVAENFPGCVCLVDRERRVLLARGHTLVGLQVSVETVEGRLLADTLRADIAERIEPVLREIFEGHSRSLQLPVDGRVHDVRGVPLRSSGNGEVEAALIVAQDVTELRQAVDEHRRLAAAIDQTQEMVLITDVGGTIQYVNPSFERTTGYTRAEIVGRTPGVLKSGQQPEEFYREMWATITRGDVWSGNLVNRRKDGTLFNEEMVISPIRDATGHIVSYAAVKRDVSARMQLERELLQAQKMESVGRLAGGVAHDFNNMLGIILGYAEMGRRGLRPDDPLHARLGEIVRAAERAGGLTRQLLAMSRKQVLQPRVVDLGELVQGLASMLGRILGEHIALRAESPTQPLRVRVDPGQIEQVILNLAVNARDAMPEGGTLRLAVGAEHGLAYLRVSDTGMGMDAETMAHIFEPFFTTKPAGKGTGLGLSSVYGIVHQSGGDVGVQSQPGRGTTFVIELPLVDSPGDAVADHLPVAAPVEAHGTVLLAEDDGALRAVGAEALRAAGYEVMEAANAGEALLIADDPKLEIDVLVTDVVMPRVGGRELSKRLRARRPDLAVLFISGFTDDTLSVADISQGSSFLQKPFSPQSLVEATRAVAAARADRAAGASA